MLASKKRLNAASALVFFIAFVVYFFSAERTGSLWDCGEFILGAYKLQVVHPPGAPLFIIIGRLFAWLGDVFSSNPSGIAFGVNLMSGFFSALTAVFVGRATTALSHKFFTGEENYDASTAEWLAVGAGVVAGLTTAFSSSIWFSAVEGEVYAMSTFFTAMTVWSVIKWYTLPNTASNDRWLVFSAYSAGLSIGVHLLSLLTFPALALFVYFKKAKTFKLHHALGSMVIGAITIPLVQKLIITGIPGLWKFFDVMLVNSFGMPFHWGLIPTLAVVAGIFFFLFRYAERKGSHVIQLVTMAALMIAIGYSTIGVVVIRANADTPVNMNVPSDATRLLPYLNREQYGERALLFGPHYEAAPVDFERTQRYGRVDFPPYQNEEVNDQEYTITNEKITQVFRGSDKILFPRVGHSEMGRPNLYRQWYKTMFSGDPKPSFLFNLGFFIKYQVNWMYTRYFMWNFVGRQNGEQGFFPWDKSKGHWKSGVKFIDEAKLYNMDQRPETMKKHRADNNYYFIPLIFGLLGLFYHARKRPNEFAGLLMLFLITGLGIILYTNQPPNEPRERDYVLVGSFFTFCMWIGMGVPAIFDLIRNRIKLSARPAAFAAIGVALVAPLLMGFQNYDDHSRNGQFGSRDYAKNFLNSLDPNAVIFTYGDNDTYPLWYVQEVENVRRDVRIVNLSLITVDWYINKLRRKVNDSPPLKLTIPASAMRGNKRNQVPFYNGGQAEVPMDLRRVLQFIGSDNPVAGPSIEFASYIPTHDMFLPTNMEAARRLGMLTEADSSNIIPAIPIKFSSNKNWMTKDEIAVLDIIASNIWERPIYFATTCKNEKLMGLNDYMQFEGLALRIIPVKSESDKSMFIYGSGRVAVDKVYDRVMNKFEWGNFDKKETFINDSYAAAVQAHRYVILRTAETLAGQRDFERAVALSDRYFEAFPHFNFPYDASILPFLGVYIQAGEMEKAKKHMRILAVETADWLEFFDSIDPAIIESSFRTDFTMHSRSLQNIMRLIQSIPDQQFRDEMTNLLNKYQANPVPN